MADDESFGEALGGALTPGRLVADLQRRPKDLAIVSGAGRSEVAPQGADALLEVYADDGRVVITDQVFPPPTATGSRSRRGRDSPHAQPISRDHARNVKRWRDGEMALRWCAAGMVEASKQFRRVNGHMHLPALRAALERHVAADTVGDDCNTQDVSAA
jgi:putative transposase